MFVVTVVFSLNEGAAPAFMPIIKAQAENSVKLEERCHQFDVSWNEDAPNKVFLYELYDDENAFEYHKKTNHYIAFSGAIENLVKDKSVRLFDQNYQGQ